MPTIETLSPQEQIDIAASVLTERLDSARDIELLSDRNGKEVVRFIEENGETFILRSYNLRDFSETSPNSPPFPIALRRFNELCEKIDIAPARNAVASIDEKSAVLVVEDLSDTIPVSEASTETKVALAARLGQLFEPSDEYRIGMQMIMHDMIVIDQSQGIEVPKFIDIDPYVIPNLNIDETDATLLRRMTTLLWDIWSNADEQKEVIAAFVKSVAESIFSDGNDPDINMLMEFSKLNLMKSGIDPR